MTHRIYNTRSLPFPRNGFSLVELLVAMTVGLILLGGIYQIFNSSTTTARAGEQLALLQENGRFVLDYMARDIRMAGYRGCSAASPLSNTLNLAGELPYNYDLAIEGFDNVPGAAPTYLADWAVDPTAGTDVLILRTRIGDEAPVSALNDADNIFVDAAVSAFSEGDILMVSDCTKARIFQVGTPSVVAPNLHLPHPAAGPTPANLTASWGGVGAPETDFDTDAEVVRFITRTYFINTSTSGTGRSLFYKEDAANAQELVEGVDTMQILYGVDTNADDAVDSYVSAAAVADWGQVLTVRLGLLLNSVAENARQDFDTQVYDVDGDTVADFDPVDDRRLRQVFATTVSLRNRLP